MKTKIAIAASFAVASIALTGCGSDDGPVDEKTPDGAIAQLVAFHHLVGEEDFAAACDLVQDSRQIDTCEESLTAMRDEQDPISALSDLSADDVLIEARSADGCAYLISRTPTGSAAMVWADSRWNVNNIGDLEDDEFGPGDGLSTAEEVEEYECDSE